MGIIVDLKERRAYQKEFAEAKKRLSADIDRASETLANKKTHLNNLIKFEQSGFADTSLFNKIYTEYLKDKVLKGEYDQVLNSAKQDVAHWTDTFKKYVANMTLIRPNSKEDISERARISKDFAKQMESIDPIGGYQLRFHATNLAAAQSIINDGGLVSTVDRTGSMLTTNLSDEISVSDINHIQYSVDYWMDTKSGVDCLPCGAMFVLEPSSKEEAEMIKDNQMNNVYFNKHPEQLVAIITSSENIPRLEKLMTDKGIDTSKLMTFDEAPTRIALKLPSLTRTVQEMMNYNSVNNSIHSIELNKERIDNAHKNIKDELGTNNIPTQEAFVQYEDLAI